MLGSIWMLPLRIDTELVWRIAFRNNPHLTLLILHYRYCFKFNSWRLSFYTNSVSTWLHCYNHVLDVIVTYKWGSKSSYNTTKRLSDYQTIKFSWIPALHTLINKHEYYNSLHSWFLKSHFIQIFYSRYGCSCHDEPHHCTDKYNIYTSI